MAAPKILEKIVERKKAEVEEMKKSGRARYYLEQAVPIKGRRMFFDAISAPNDTGLNLIAEYKRASPSKGDIRPDSTPEEISLLYKECGAVAMSVLTDIDFKGELEYLERVRRTIDLPVLRKDFLVDEAQIYESRFRGAHAILLIASLLSEKQISDYNDIAKGLGMDSLIEVHDRQELDKVEGIAEIIGINNRDLRSTDFHTDIQTTLDLLRYVPSGRVVVTESGISTYEHVKKLSVPPVKAMLVGEGLMSAKANPTLEAMKKAIYRLRGMN